MGRSTPLRLRRHPRAAGRDPDALAWFHRTHAIDADQFTDADRASGRAGEAARRRRTARRVRTGPTSAPPRVSGGTRPASRRQPQSWRRMKTIRPSPERFSDGWRKGASSELDDMVER